MVGAARFDEREILAQREEREQPEEHQRAGRSDDQRQTEDNAESPPSANALVEVVDGGARRRRSNRRLQRQPDDRGDDQQPEDRCAGPHQRRIDPLPVKRHCALSAQIALRARVEKVVLRLGRVERERRTEGQPADEGHRQKLSFRQNAIEILHVRGNQLHARLLPAEIVETAFKRRHLVTRSARAFGKDDERVTIFHAGGDAIDGFTRLRFDAAVSVAPRNEERVEDADGNGAAKPVVPVIFRRNRPRDRAKFARQRRPEHDEVEMTGVIGEKNALLRAGQAIAPRYLHAADGARDAGDEAGKRTQSHRRSKSP